MKKTIIILAFFSIGIIAKASPVRNEQAAIRTVSSQEVPQSVQTAFTSRFPNARLKNWEIQRGVFIADFRLDRKKIFAYFNADGSWRGTETPIKWTKNLPSAVHSGWLKSDYAGWYVQDIKKIETPEGPLYTLHVDNGPTLDSDHHDIDFEECVIFFNESGALVRKDRMP